MNLSTEKLREDLRHGIDHLRTLRDEIRVDLHLAGMDARDRWHQLEHQVEKKVGELERAAVEASAGVSEAARVAVADLIDRLKEFRTSLAHKDA